MSGLAAYRRKRKVYRRLRTLAYIVGYFLFLLAFDLVWETGAWALRTLHDAAFGANPPWGGFPKW